MKTLGFVGAGTIAAAFIEGIVGSGRRNPVFLSPRSADTSQALAKRFDQVSRSASNAEVVENSDLVFLAVRPTQVEEALRGVEFRRGQIVCSFVTGLDLQALAIAAPGVTVCRVLPLPTIAFCKGPLLHYPPVGEVLDLLDGLGTIIVPRSESELVAMGGVSGFMSTFFQLQATLADWLETHGVEPAAASTYTRAMFQGLAETAIVDSRPLAELADEHQTAGGLNERTRGYLDKAGWFAQTCDAMSSVKVLNRMELE